MTSVHHLHRICRCGHHDFDHISRYYETGERGPVCQRKGCGCRHFTLNSNAIAAPQIRCELCQEPVHTANGVLIHDFTGREKCTYKSHL